MAKNSFQDVTPPNRRSIRDIQITKRAPRRPLAPTPASDYSPTTVSSLEEEVDKFQRSVKLDRPVKVSDVRPVSRAPQISTAPSVHVPVVEEDEEESPSRGYEAVSSLIPIGNSHSKRNMSKIFISVAGIVIIGFVFLMMNAFTSADITIIPKKETVSFNTALNISKALTASTTLASLKYEVVQLDKTGSKEVPANGEEQVERKASGKIIIYNNFSSDPQRFITRTRFETPEGLTFRISDPVTVPGKVGSTPGSVEATVYADEAGEKYNVGMKDFTVPGFKTDSARYKAFYARSKTNMEGGFVGKVSKVADADKASAIKEINDSLKADLDKEILSKIPETLVVLNGATIYDFKSLPQDDTSSKVTLKQEATVYAIALDRVELANIIKKQALAAWDNIPSTISSFDKMSLSFDNTTWVPGQADPVGVKISGSAEFVAMIDGKTLVDSLLGKNKSELGNLINNSTSIESATAAVRPVWKSSFPDNATKIKIKVAD